MNPFKFVFCVAFGTKLTEEQGTKSMQHIQFFFYYFYMIYKQTNIYIWGNVWTSSIIKVTNKRREYVFFLFFEIKKKKTFEWD